MKHSRFGGIQYVYIKNLGNFGEEKTRRTTIFFPKRSFEEVREKKGDQREEPAVQ